MHAKKENVTYPERMYGNNTMGSKWGGRKAVASKRTINNTYNFYTIQPSDQSKGNALQLPKKA